VANGQFETGNKAGAGARRTYRAFIREFERETGRQAVQRALETALADARAHLAVLRVRQVAPRVLRAEKRRAAREARFWTAQIISLAEQLKPFVLSEPGSNPAKPSPEEAIARLREAVREANEREGSKQ
jgi:hypothetical protein